jgi:hypothetical protein
MDGAVHDSQIATAISISVETTQSTDQNRVCAVQEICVWIYLFIYLF